MACRQPSYIYIFWFGAACPVVSYAIIEYLTTKKTFVFGTACLLQLWFWKFRLFWQLRQRQTSDKSSTSTISPYRPHFTIVMQVFCCQSISSINSQSNSLLDVNQHGQMDLSTVTRWKYRVVFGCLIVGSNYSSQEPKDRNLLLFY